MTSIPDSYGFFDIEMIEADGLHTAKVYLIGLNDTRALLAEATLETVSAAFRMAVNEAMDQLATLGREVQQAREK